LIGQVAVALKAVRSLSGTNAVDYDSIRLSHILQLIRVAPHLIALRWVNSGLDDEHTMDSLTEDQV